jgi:phytoene dehydrogenase-like protein
LSTSTYDAVIIGSGPNGLTAAIELARNGQRVLVLEAQETYGGGMRTRELTLPGFHHDFCSAVHPIGRLSPYWTELPLADFGLEWIYPPASVAHPLDGEEAVLLTRSLAETADNLGPDGEAWTQLLQPFLNNPHALLADILGPLGIPNSPLLLARFGLSAIWPATRLARRHFRSHRAKALLAGCAAHGVLPLENWATGAFALMFAITGHVVDWPVPRGGSHSIAAALAGYLKSLGGEIRTGERVSAFAQLPPARAYLFDTDPYQLADIAGDQLPNGYRRRLRRYRYGPATFKLDWALDGPIPWRDPRCRRASTVHVGGTLEEIAAAERTVARGRVAERPYLILCQQSEFDPGRAPAGQHTGYAYCHVPARSEVDVTDYIEAQVERFAPGFRDRILARHVTTPRDFERHNPNYVGGAITGGSADITQLFTRPVARLDPYATPNARIFICSASTPPGGGVHGMCGYHAARSVLRRWG